MWKNFYWNEWEGSCVSRGTRTISKKKKHEGVEVVGGGRVRGGREVCVGGTMEKDVVGGQSPWVGGGGGA